MVELAAHRRTALEGRSVVHPWVRVSPAATASRVSLRAPAESVAELSKALKLTMPQVVRTSAQMDDRAALCLGPDEWLVLDLGGADLVAAAAKVKAFHSAVDVSHRNIGIEIVGKGAEVTLSSACPQDLSSARFPVGACARTIFGKIEIVVWRTAEDAFRVECWRSFSDYAFTLLEECARDAAA